MVAGIGGVGGGGVWVIGKAGPFGCVEGVFSSGAGPKPMVFAGALVALGFGFAASVIRLAGFGDVVAPRRFASGEGGS